MINKKKEKKFASIFFFFFKFLFYDFSLNIFFYKGDFFINKTHVHEEEKIDSE
jgi:hypothetical protein